MIGNVLAWILRAVGPKGLEFARYSIDYHFLRNYLYVMRNWDGKKADMHIPSYVKYIVDEYDKDGGGQITKLLNK